MSRKDFELIASTIKSASIPEDSRASIARDFAYKLTETNPRFNVSRFLQACGVGE